MGGAEAAAAQLLEASPPAWILKPIADIYYELGKYAEAIPYYRMAAATAGEFPETWGDPEWSDVWRSREWEVRCHINLRDDEAAKASVLEFIANAPAGRDISSTLEQMVEMYTSGGRTDAAEEFCMHIASNAAEPVSAWAMEAISQVRADREASSIEATVVDSVAAEMMENAEVARQSNNLALARLIYQQIVAETQDEDSAIRALVELAEIDKLEGRPIRLPVTASDAAIEGIKHIIRHFSKPGTQLRGFGRPSAACLNAEIKLQDADFEAFQLELPANDDSFESFIYAGVMNGYYLREYAKGVESLRKAADMYPEHPTAPRMLYLCGRYILDGNLSLEILEDTYATLVHRYPQWYNNWRVCQNLGQLYIDQGRWEEAIPYLSLAVERSCCPQHAQTPLYWLGMAYHRTGDGQRAAEALQRWLKDAPANSPAANEVVQIIASAKESE